MTWDSGDGEIGTGGAGVSQVAMNAGHRSGSVRSRARHLLVLMAATVLGFGLAAAPSEAAEGDPVITWPTMTKFNPDITPYVVETEYDGADSLFLVVWAPWDAYTAVPMTVGEHEVVIPERYDGDLTVAVARCATASYSSNCDEVSARDVTAYDEVVARFDLSGGVGPQTQLALELAPTDAGTYDAEWQVRPYNQPDEAPLLVGTASDIPVGNPMPSIGANDVLNHNTSYSYRAQIRRVIEPYGQLETTLEGYFTWDEVNEVTGLHFEVHDRFLGAMLRDVDLFYPHEDARYDWRDHAFIVLEGSAAAIRDMTAVITIADENGETVFRKGGLAWRRWSWNGHDGNDLVAEGFYDVTIEVTDPADNVARYTEQIQVSHDQLVRTTWTTRVSPKESIIDRYVGRCGAIKVPARRAWRGSIGLRSSTAGPRCRTLESQSVTAVHGIYLPKSPLGRYDRYDNLRVGVYGGGAGRGSNYLVQWLWSRDKKWVGRSQFGRNLTLHQGQRMGAGSVLGDEDEESPYVIWSSGLAEGSQYDIKYYSVSVRYWAIQ